MKNLNPLPFLILSVIFFSALAHAALPDYLDRSREDGLKKLYKKTGYYVGMLPCTAPREDGSEMRLFYLIDFNDEKELCYFKLGALSEKLNGEGLTCTVDKNLGCFDERVYKEVIARQKESKPMDRDYIKYKDHDGRFRSLNLDSEPYNPKECQAFETVFKAKYSEVACVKSDTR